MKLFLDSIFIYPRDGESNLEANAVTESCKSCVTGDSDQSGR